MDPKEIALQGAVGAFPFGRVAETLGATGKAARALSGAAEGAALGAAYPVAESEIQKGELPSASEVGTGAALGLGFGALGGSVSRETKALPAALAATEKKPGSIWSALSPQTATEEGKGIWQGLSEERSRKSIQNSQTQAGLTEAFGQASSMPLDQQMNLNDRIFARSENVSPFAQSLQETPGYAKGRGAEFRQQEFTPQEMQIIGPVQKAMESAAAEMQDAGLEFGVRSSYLPLLAKDPEKFQAWLNSQEGPGLASGALKRRSYTLEDVRQNGGGLVTENPVELGLIRAFQESKLAMERRFLNGQLEEGVFRDIQTKEPDLLPQYFKGVPKPEPKPVGVGEKMIDPRITDALQLPNLAGPSGAVDTLHDQLLLQSTNPKAQQAADILSQIRQFQVGTSAYHYFMEGFNTLAKGIGRGIGEVASGRPLEGIGTIAKSVTSLDAFDALSRGRRVMEEAKTVDLLNGPISDDLRTAMKAGFNFMNEKRLGRNLSQIASEEGQAAASQLPGSIGAMVSRATQFVSAPLMEKIVPAVKLGTLLKDVESRLVSTGPLDPKATQKLIFDRARNVDAVFGQMANYNSPFSQQVRKLLGWVIQFPGWNIGSTQLLSGALKTPLTVARGVMGKEVPEMDRAASEFALGLTMAAGMVGSAIHYALNGTPPESVIDAFYPKTGKTMPDGQPERLQLQNYLRDVVALGHGIAPKIARGEASAALGQLGSNVQRAVTSKESLALRVPWEVANNIDHFGRQIFDPQASLGKNAEYGAQYALEQILPFSARSLVSPTGQGPPGGFLGGLAGLQRAPAYLSRSEAGQEIADATARKMSGEGSISRADYERRQERNVLREKIRDQTPQEKAAAVAEATKTGLVKPRERTEFVRGVTEPGIVNSFRNLRADEAWRIWQKATPAEKKQLQFVLRQKLSNAGDLEHLRELRVAGF